MLTTLLVLATADVKPASGALLQQIIEDATLPHVSIPRGVPESVDWRLKPRQGYGNTPPKDWSAIIAWGQVYEPVTNSPSKNTRVAIRNIQLSVLRRRCGQGRRGQVERGVVGAACREAFVNDESKAPDARIEPDGSLSIVTGPGFNYHFWPRAGRGTMDPTDIAGVYAAVQARLVLADPKAADDRAQARFMMSMGADYWKAVDSAWDQFKTNGDVAIGRFRWVGREWGWHHMISLSADAARRTPPPAPVEQE